MEIQAVSGKGARNLSDFRDTPCGHAEKCREIGIKKAVSVTIARVGTLMQQRCGFVCFYLLSNCEISSWSQISLHQLTYMILSRTFADH